MAIVLQMKLFISEISSINLGSLRRVTSKELRFEKFGEPLNVIEMVERPLPPLRENDVLIRMLAAPVNPADINIIQGRYAIKPSLPTIGGNEGVGIVEKVGEGVTRMAVGDKVIVAKPGQGTWRNYGVFDKSLLRTVPQHLGLAESATLTVNPCTAYRMLSDYKPVRKQKDLVVIQNGANGSVGQNVIQLCNAWGIQTVNIVRDRPDIEKIKHYLCCLGATWVLTEEELKCTNIFANKIIKRPVLGLNCVGGKKTVGLIKHMAPSGIMVTYGGMSKRPVTIPTSAFIFKNLKFVGFWMTAWYSRASELDKEKMLSELINMMCETRLRAPVHKFVHFERYKEALENTLSSKGSSGFKYIMDFSRSYS